MSKLTGSPKDFECQLGNQNRHLGFQIFWSCNVCQQMVRSVLEDLGWKALRPIKKGLLGVPYQTVCSARIGGDYKLV